MCQKKPTKPSLSLTPLTLPRHGFRRDSRLEPPLRTTNLEILASTIEFWGKSPQILGHLCKIEINVQQISHLVPRSC